MWPSTTFSILVDIWYQRKYTNNFGYVLLCLGKRQRQYRTPIPRFFLSTGVVNSLIPELWNVTDFPGKSFRGLIDNQFRYDQFDGLVIVGDYTISGTVGHEYAVITGLS